MEDSKQNATLPKHENYTETNNNRHMTGTPQFMWNCRQRESQEAPHNDAGRDLQHDELIPTHFGA